MNPIERLATNLLSESPERPHDRERHEADGVHRIERADHHANASSIESPTPTPNALSPRPRFAASSTLP